MDKNNFNKYKFENDVEIKYSINRLKYKIFYISY